MTTTRTNSRPLAPFRTDAVLIVVDGPDGEPYIIGDDRGWYTRADLAAGAQIPLRFRSVTHARQWAITRGNGYWMSCPVVGRRRFLRERTVRGGQEWKHA